MDSKEIENKIFIVHQSDPHPNQINHHKRYVQIKQTRYIKTCLPKKSNHQNLVVRCD